MDPDHALDSERESSEWDLANEIIGNMVDRWKMAAQWSDWLGRLHIFFREKRKVWKKAGGSPASIDSDRGGGLREYTENFERAQKDFGSLEDDTWNGEARKTSYAKLQHEQDADDQSEAPSPAITFKSEKDDMTVTRAASTPAPSATTAFTPVNVKSTLTSPYVESHASPTLPPNTYGARSTHQSPTTPSNHVHRPYQSTHYPADASQRFYPNAMHSNGSLSQMNPYQNQVALQPEPMGWPVDTDQMNLLSQEGGMSINGQDLASMQLGDNRVGFDSFMYGSEGIVRWTGAIPLGHVSQEQPYPDQLQSHDYMAQAQAQAQLQQGHGSQQYR